MKILYGRKTTLLPFSPDADMEYFLNLLQHEGQSMGMCFFKSPEAYLAWVLAEIHAGRWLIWTVLTNGGNAKKLGFIVVYDPNPLSVTLQGLMDKSILKGLPELLERKDKVTFAEDSLNLVIDHVFNDIKMNRISCEVMKSNSASRRLVEKVGFVREGKLREACSYKGRIDDLMLYGLIQSDRKGDKNEFRVKEDKSGRIASSVSATIV